MPALPKVFSTTTELESHYQWHDDMEYRHHRDKCRRKLPGLKLQTKTLQKRSSRAGVADFGRKSVFLADEELAAIPEDFGDESAEQGEWPRVKSLTLADLFRRSQSTTPGQNKR